MASEYEKEKNFDSFHPTTGIRMKRIKEEIISRVPMLIGILFVALMCNM